MIERIKRFTILVFGAFIISDICSYIRYAIKHDSFKINDYYGIYTKMSCGNIYNLATIYILSVCVIYFIFNFFKKERQFYSYLFLIKNYIDFKNNI